MVAAPSICAGSSPSGFSLLELLVTLALVAALAAIACGLIGSAGSRAARVRAEGDLSTIATALEAYQRHYGDYPRTVDPVRLFESLSGARGPSGAVVAGPDFIGSRVVLSPDPDPTLRDPWGNAYRYWYDASLDDEYLLWSAGPDGRDHVGGDGRPLPGHVANSDNIGSMSR